MLNARNLKMSAREKLPAGHKKLALIHTAVALGVSLLITLLHYYLSNQIGNTGGLSGLGARTVLETVQMVLQYASNLILPFWEIGFLFAALQMVRGQKAEVHSLLEGFRRFGPVLRLYLIQGILFMGVGMACAYAGALVFSMSPLALPLMEKLMPMVESGADITQVQNDLLSMPIDELMQYFWPFLVIAAILFCVLAVLLLYRFKLAEFFVMDRKGTGALAALMLSSRTTKGHRMKLFRLDLSFWWFYLLVGLSAVVMNGDVLLQYMAVDLPVAGETLWLICYLVGLLLQLVIYWQFYGHVMATYATAYETLLQMPAVPPRPQSIPKNLPWDDYNAQQ